MKYLSALEIFRLSTGIFPDRHDIAEILLIVALNTIKQTNKHIEQIYHAWEGYLRKIPVKKKRFFTFFISLEKHLKLSIS
jgi:hypothetical protein